jgi:hypothetical protein
MLKMAIFLMHFVILHPIIIQNNKNKVTPTKEHTHNAHYSYFIKNTIWL